MFRDVESATTNAEDRHPGRRVVAVIGIDKYQNWQRLRNAVNDARAAQQAFIRLGFEQLTEPLFDENATADAMLRLVRDDLARLSKDDSLVLFFAGHGHTITTYQGSESIKTGYIIPVDGHHHDSSRVRWLRLDHWLSEAARHEMKHVLVFLDSCHSGMALEGAVTSRGVNPQVEAFERLARRTSRRVVTSAQEGEVAMDTGPRGSNSLFTGCLIDALDGGVAQHGQFVTGSQLGLYLQKNVSKYRNYKQTPDFGAFERDRRGELVVQIVTTTAVEEAAEREAAAAKEREAAAAKEREAAAAKEREAAAAKEREKAAAQEREKAAAQEREKAAAQERQEAAAKAWMEVYAKVATKAREAREEATAKVREEAADEAWEEVAVKAAAKSQEETAAKSQEKAAVNTVAKVWEEFAPKRRRRSISAAPVVKAVVAGAIGWMFAFNAITVYEFISDGSWLYRPDGEAGLAFPDATIAGIAWVFALYVAGTTCYIFMRRARFSHDTPHSTSVASTAVRYALICGSLAFETAFTVTAMYGISPRAPLGFLFGVSCLVGGLVAFFTNRFLVGFLAALRRS